MEQGINAVVKAIKNNKVFLITSHVNVEGDAIGSQLAMASLLRRLKKKVFIVDNDPVPAIYRFMPGSDSILARPPEGEKSQVAVLLDCAVKNRIGNVKKFIEGAPVILNIDHHVGNDMFGDVNWIDKNSSSVGEMLWHLFKKLGIKINHDEAVSIYTAILTDTGSFRYVNTTPMTHRITAELLEAGVVPKTIFSHVYEAGSFGGRKILARALMSLKQTAAGKIVYFELTKKMVGRAEISETEFSEFINYARFIKGVEAAVLFSDIGAKNATKVSMRSNTELDVYKIAKALGGGGHRTAAGCTLALPIGRAKRVVLRKLVEEIGYGG